MLEAALYSFPVLLFIGAWRADKAIARNKVRK